MLPGHSLQALWMVAAALSFSIMGAFIKQVSIHYSSFEIVFYRGLVSALLIGAMMAATGVSFGSRHLRGHASRSAVGTTSMMCWFYAIGVLPLGTAITLSYTAPLFIALIVAGAALRGGSRSESRGALYVAIACGFAGMLVMLRPTIARDAEIGLIAGIAAGMLSAVALLLVRQLGRQGEPELRVVFYFAIANIVIAGAISSLLGWQPLHLSDLIQLLTIGILASFGQLAMTRAFSRGPALTVASLQYSGVVFASLIGWWIFDERMSFPEIAGMVMIVASGFSATWVSSRPIAARTGDAEH